MDAHATDIFIVAPARGSSIVAAAGDTEGTGRCSRAWRHATRGCRCVARSAVLVAAVATGLAGPAIAASYPDHPVRIVVPLAAGGAFDIAARLLQPRLEKALGQPVIVENRSGASGTIGADAVAKAPPDGHTLLMTPSTFTVNPAVSAKMPFDPQRDFQPIVLVGQNPLLFLVNEAVPARNLAEFVAYARAENGKVNYATPGAASQAHLIIEMWSARAGIKMQQIPYRGGGPAVLATATGETQLTLMSPLVAMPQVEAKKLRPLATGSKTRDAQFPDLPTLAESGYPGIEAVQWFGLLTTAGTPRDIVDRLNAEVNKALADPDLQKSFSDQGVSTAGGSVEEFATLIATELRNWRETAEKANIKAE